MNQKELAEGQKVEVEYEERVIIKKKKIKGTIGFFKTKKRSYMVLMPTHDIATWITLTGEEKITLLP